MFDSDLRRHLGLTATMKEDSASHDLSPHLPRPSDGAPDGNHNMVGVAPRRPWACHGHMAGGYLLSRNDEISPAWEGHCEHVPSL
jgi:hypothetical protein